MLGFGLNVTAFTITDYFARSMDRAALGYSVGPRELGYYQNAFTVYDNCITVCSLHNVATASLSKLREDIPALKRAWANALSTLVWFAAPAFAVLAVVGQDLVVVLLGAKWVAAGSLLVVFALRGPAHVVERTHSWLHVACGTPHRWRHWGLLNVAAMIVALACGLPFGTFGIATAYAVATTLLCIPAVAYSGAPIGIRATDVLRAVGPQVVAAFAAAALAMLARHALLQDAPALLRLVILGVLCSGAYLAIVTLVFRVTKPLRLALSLLRNRGRGAAGPPT
jgi:PST family polysaccharide transporter